MRPIVQRPSGRLGNFWIVAGALLVAAVCGPGDSPSSLFNGLGRPFWMAFDALSLAMLVRWRPNLWLLIADNPLLMAWPGLAMLSALWSVAPDISLYHGLQLALTILVGLSARASMDLRSLLRTLVWGLGLASALSIVAIVRHAPGAVGPDGVWLGAFPHKNTLGSMMVLQLLTCSVLALDGRHRRLAGLAAMPALVLLGGSHSGTAYLSLAATIAIVPVALCYRSGSTAFGLILSAGLMAAGGMLYIATSGLDMASAVLSGLGKDDTLSGRTILWQFGVDQIWAHPFLGLGYKAYWQSPVTGSAYLRYVIGQDLWFFHNNFIDVGVAFGIPGILLFCSVLLAAARRSIAAFVEDASILNLWAPLFVACTAISATAENPLFQNNSLHQSLLAIAMAAPATVLRCRSACAASASVVRYEGSMA